MLVVRSASASAGDRRGTGWIPGSGRSPGGGHGNQLQYCLENPMDRGAWRAREHRGEKSQTRLKCLSTHTQGIEYKAWLLRETPVTKGQSYSLPSALKVSLLFFLHNMCQLLHWSVSLVEIHLIFKVLFFVLSNLYAEKLIQRGDITCWGSPRWWTAEPRVAPASSNPRPQLFSLNGAGFHCAG